MRILTISPSTEGLPYPPFMDHHHPHFIRRFGNTMEDVYITESKITTTTKFPTMETTGSKLSTLSIKAEPTNLDSIYTSYKPLVPDCNPTTAERTLFQWHVTFK